MVFGFVFFVIAFFWGPPTPPGRNFVAAGLACWILAEILKGAEPLIHHL